MVKNKKIAQARSIAPKEYAETLAAIKKQIQETLGKTALATNNSRVNKSIDMVKYETKLVRTLPENLKNYFPTVEEIEAELEKAEALGRTEGKKVVKRGHNK